MAKLKTWLTTLLALQLVLAGSLLAFNYQREAGGEPGVIFDQEAVTVDRIEISDGEQQITVAKEGEQWVLPDQDGLPATESKVSATIDSVAEAAMVWPVASTGASHERFEVAEDNFQREVKLFAGDNQVGHFYLGTSPGFRKVHLRQAGSDDVYAVSLNTFDFPVAADEWLEKTILNVAEAEEIQGPDFTIKKVGEDWQFAGASAEGEDAPTLNLDKANQLALAFGNFRVTDFADAAPDPEPIALTVKSGGDSWQFSFYQADDKYYVKRNDRDQVFTLSKYDFERLAQVNREALVLEEEASEETENVTDQKEAGVEGNDTGNAAPEAPAE